MSKNNGWERHEPLEQGFREPMKLVGAEAWVKGPCRVILVRREPFLHPEFGRCSRQHLSISCEDRYPTWDEIYDARYSLMGLGLNVVMFLPPTPQYVNIHPNCFHLYETYERAPQ